MTKLNAKSLTSLRDEKKKAFNSRSLAGNCTRIIVGMGSCGIAAGAKEVLEVFSQEIATKGLKDIEVTQTGCLGTCTQEPNVEIIVPGMDPIIYGNVNIKTAKKLVSTHIVKKTILEANVQEKLAADIINDSDEAINAKKQIRIVLRNCGIIDPEKIDEYIARDGYQALKKVIFDLTPDQMIEELKTAGLRGRGGAGFPTGVKWSFTKNTESDQKFIVCNADEGDPGAYMDRSTLEGDPHSVLEAMAIAGHTVGANQGYIYIRAEYPLAIERLNIAIAQAKEIGLLGDNIMESDFSFDIELRFGAGAFVCGEETALLASIEGERGMPTPRPPFPAVKGLWGHPTVINNVETWASIPVIINKGSKWFSSIGTDDTKGTKVFAITGNVKRSGLVEVPMGTTLREIIYDIAGGIEGDRAFKAAQSGGPSGGVIPAQHLDTPIDYKSLMSIGSMMGSGGLIVMDEQDCIVDVVKFYLQFSVDESCGKCAPCRVGGYQLLQILEKITKGNGEQKDIDDLKKIAKAMQKASLCGLGQTSSNPILSTLHYFMDEYQSHIKNKKCPAGKCKSLISYEIIEDKCKRCSLCQKVCPVHAIPGNRNDGFTIDQDKCIKCGQCFEACNFESIKNG